MIDKLKKWYRETFDEEKSFFLYIGFAFFVAIMFTILTSCASPKKKEGSHTYRVEVGKKCVLKEDGTVAWSYVWIARDDVVLVKCK